MTTIDELLDEQQRYYNGRATEYGEWIATYMGPVQAGITELVRKSPLTGDVLELASGTGYWTTLLSELADRVTAVDAAPDMINIIRSLDLPNVDIIQTDLFHWQPPRKWDTIFFVHWLAHVPPPLLPQFWETIDQALRPGGSVIFVDVTAAEQEIEEELLQDRPVPGVRRRLNDGRKFTIVKKYWEPDVLLARLAEFGWYGRFTRVGHDIGRGFVFYEVERNHDAR